MKSKLLLLCSLFGIMTIVGCSSKTEPEENENDFPPTKEAWVDLGLPSGTLWKSINEKNASGQSDDCFTWNEAMSLYGEQMPTYDQMVELMEKCEWISVFNKYKGFKVQGPNGNYIWLPSYQDNGTFMADYWTSSAYSGKHAWALRFFVSGSQYYIDYQLNIITGSVRLVKKP